MLAKTLVSKKTVGLLGENCATNYLLKKGFKVLERNYRTPRWGELDVVAKEGDVLVFVEVKTRTSLKYGPPQEAVDFFKRRSLKRACDYYITAHNYSRLPCRLDLITLLLEPGSSTIRKLAHFRNVPF